MVAAHPDRIWAVAFAPDGLSLLSVGREGTVRRWNAVTGEAQGEPVGWPDQAVESAAIEPARGLVALGRHDGTVSLLDLATGQLHDTIDSGKSQSIESVAWGLHGELLAVGDQEGTVTLWEIGDEPALTEELSPHTGAVRSLAIDPMNQSLVSGGADGLLHLTPLQSGSQQIEACRIANRNLSEDEWQQFVGATWPYQLTCPTLQPVLDAAATNATVTPTVAPTVMPTVTLPAPEPTADNQEESDDSSGGGGGGSGSGGGGGGN
jgi:hypothetical protein